MCFDITPSPSTHWKFYWKTSLAFSQREPVDVLEAVCILSVYCLDAWIRGFRHIFNLFLDKGQRHVGK